MDQQLEMEAIFKNSSIEDLLRKLIRDSMGFSRNTRACSGIANDEFIFMGIYRALGNYMLSPTLFDSAIPELNEFSMV